MRNQDTVAARSARGAALVAALAAAVLAPLGAVLAPGAAAQTALPDINVIATTPLAPSRSPKPTPSSAPSSGPATPREAPAAPAAAPAAPADPGLIDRDKVPANTAVITARDVDHARSLSLLDSLAAALPGVSLGDQSGNAFQRDLDYRGFVASPVPGTPQGIAVYQNGVRINEAYGDIVNWSFIPEQAIGRLSLVPNSPVFGLNAIGGALGIDMKNGFTFQGKGAEVLGGSYGRIAATGEVGVQDGNRSAYAAFDATNDAGWRQFSSASRLRRMYVDVGARDDRTEFHVAFTGADNSLGAVAATPAQLLAQKWSSVYTWPQTTRLQLAFLTTSLNFAPTDTLSFQATAYYRGFWQAHVDGNGTDAQPCTAGGLLCIGDGVTPINVNAPGGVPDTVRPGAALGEIDRNWTTTNGFGGTAQATGTAKLLDHDNHVVAGVSLDHGRTQFTGNSELGTIDQNLFVGGTGVYIDQPAADVTPVSVRALDTYTGVFATDTFDVTSKLAVTAGGRFNVAQINLSDETGTNPLLDSSSRYRRLNPVIGATYKIMPQLTAYAGYSEANRAPTPLELGCASPTTPCLIDNFLIADPPLKQVVSHTWEAGLRGSTGGGDTGRLSWGLGAFHTGLTDDIINIASQVPLFGYFQNAGKTLRQGVEAKLAYARDRWSAYANYTYVDATYRSALTISSPNNPAADANGDIFVVPGDHIPAVPAHRFKAGLEYAAGEAWKVGADLHAVGRQYLIHDDANQNPQVPAYFVVNLHGSYRLTPNVELFGLVNNLFNRHYDAAGAFASTAGFNANSVGGANLMALSDPRTFVPGMPLAVYGGIRAKF